MRDNVWHGKLEGKDRSELGKLIVRLRELQSKMRAEAQQCREVSEKIRAMAEEDKRG